TPSVTQVYSLFETSTPQLYLDIDRTKAQLLGVPVPDVFNALQVYLGSSYVNDFNLFGRTFRVVAQADSADRREPSDILKIRVRNSSGDTVPLGSFTTVRTISGPYRVPRYNIYPAAELDGAAAPGYSQGQANDFLTQVGFVVLIGLAAKNAILIVEFAKQLESPDRDRFAAAAEAARLRLRPILMTSLAFIFGVAPLVWATGAGAELRQTLGTAVFFGMIGVTVFGLMFTPVFYVVCSWIAGLASRRRGDVKRAAQPAE